MERGKLRFQRIVFFRILLRHLLITILRDRAEGVVLIELVAGIIIINCFNIALWDILNNIFLIMILGGMVVSIYIIGKKYE